MPTRASLLFALSLAGCGGPGLVDPDLGPIEGTLDDVERTAWPGVDNLDGTHTIPLSNGFSADTPAPYWFFGLATRATADMFVACRRDDDACPLDPARRLDFSRIVGGAVFGRVPGDAGYSVYWQLWVLRVPDDYPADAVKTLEAVTRWQDTGAASVEELAVDFGTFVGPTDTGTFVGVRRAVAHAPLVLAGTALEGNGAPFGGAPTVAVPLRSGWYEGHSVGWYDFSVSEAVFPEDALGDVRPAMPAADIFVLYRSCAAVPTPALCEGDTSGVRPVSERGVARDLTGDGDERDNNNLLPAAPGVLSPFPEDAPYSPLWRVMRVQVTTGYDPMCALVDTTGAQDQSSVTSVAAMRDLIDQGLLLPPLPLDTDKTGVPLSGGTFFDCPSQVAAP
ncbi:MAG TPA: hypothetical protein VG389_10820 [Myxococcota bacterium]|jgi:hypothetical protein|nr:hypothetical protein [Myxococcota bacterium]